METLTKLCNRCGIQKPVPEFGYRSDAPNKPRTYCAPCHNKRPLGWSRRYATRRADYHLRSTYGINMEQKEALLSKQNGCCAICNADSPGSKKGWHVDHDHATGTVRGILCHGCNTALGKFNDDPAVLLRAVAYLTKGELN